MLRLALLAALAASPIAAAPCGGGFADYLAALQAEAIAQGHDPNQAAAFFRGLKQDPKVLRADKAQGVFQLDFITFSRRLISAGRLKSGQAAMQREDASFTRIARDLGVPRGILTAFWTFETDLGQVQGDFNTANALATLGHDCRRPELFQPQVFAALSLYERGDFDPARTTGAWAGEIGMVQMLPADILRNGADGDGDGHVSLKTSAPDALLSGARMLAALGWQPNQPWLQEVTVPDSLDWGRTGTDTALPVADWLRMGVTPRSGDAGADDLMASLLLPVGRHGPAFLAYPNFKVLFEWNSGSWPAADRPRSLTSFAPFARAASGCTVGAVEVIEDTPASVRFTVRPWSPGPRSSWSTA